MRKFLGSGLMVTVYALLVVSLPLAWAASLRISERPAATTPLDGTEILGIIQSGLDMQTTVADVLNGAAPGWPTVITGAATTSEAAPIMIRGIGGQSTNGADFDQNSGGFFEWVCVVANVRNACDYARQLAAGKKVQIKNSGGNVIFESDEATGYTRFTDEKHFAVATCNNATASANFDLHTANSPAVTCEGTNTRMATLDFDGTVDEAFYDSWTLPASFGGTINGHFRWKGANIANEVNWCMQLVRVPDGATSDQAFPAVSASNCVSDTAKGTTLQENIATITGVTCTSCVAGDRVDVRISRDADQTVGAGTDDFVGDAKLITYGRTIR